MKTIGVILFAALILFLLGYFGFLEFLGINGAKCGNGVSGTPIKRFTYGKCQIQDGQDCIFASEPAFVKGITKDGACISAGNTIIGGGGNNSNPNPPAATVEMVEVINPKGSYMYYKQPTKTEGVYMYGKSNVLIPQGEKLTLIGSEINTYQGLPAKVIETTYKQYGANSGFFDIADLKKI